MRSMSQPAGSCVGFKVWVLFSIHKKLLDDKLLAGEIVVSYSYLCGHKKQSLRGVKFKEHLCRLLIPGSMKTGCLEPVKRFPQYLV